MAVKETQRWKAPTDPTKLAEAVAKIGDSQLANKAYDDLAASPMREGGKAMTDVVKTFRLFLAPIQLLAGPPRPALDVLGRTWCWRLRWLGLCLVLSACSSRINRQILLLTSLMEKLDYFLGLGESVQF